MIIKHIGMIPVEIAKTKQKTKLHFKIWSSSPRGQGSFHNFGNLGSQLKTRCDDSFGEKRIGDLYHKSSLGISFPIRNFFHSERQMMRCISETLSPSTEYAPLQPFIGSVHKSLPPYDPNEPI